MLFFRFESIGTSETAFLLFILGVAAVMIYLILPGKKSK